MPHGDKQADLAGPGVSTYEEVEKILPKDYSSILTPMDTMKALFDRQSFHRAGSADKEEPCDSRRE